MGRPDGKEYFIDMGKGWGDTTYTAPPVFYVMEYQLDDPERPRGRRHFVKVGYPFWRKTSDGLLIYKRPGYRVGSL
jgi:hypothetical protein